MPALLDSLPDELARAESLRFSDRSKKPSGLGGAGASRWAGIYFVQLQRLFGLAHDPRVIAAGARRLCATVQGGASRLVTGSHPPYAELEEYSSPSSKAPSAAGFRQWLPGESRRDSGSGWERRPGPG